MTKRQLSSDWPGSSISFNMTSSHESISTLLVT